MQLWLDNLIYIEKCIFQQSIAYSMQNFDIFCPSDRNGVSKLFNMSILQQNVKQILKNYLRNYLWEIYSRKCLQDIFVNIKRMIKYQAKCFLFAWIINPVIIIINTMNTITMPIISYFILAIILQHIWDKHVKIFFLCCIIKNLQNKYNVKWQSSILPYTLPNLSTKIFRPSHHFHQFWKKFKKFGSCGWIW